MGGHSEDFRSLGLIGAEIRAFMYFHFHFREAFSHKNGHISVPGACSGPTDLKFSL